jgi:uracil-DNA glycosylase family 4
MAPFSMKTRRRKTINTPLEDLQAEIIQCRACPRLVQWREQVAEQKVARFRDQVYWGKPIPGFGDPAARLLVVGLAPAAHGGNRTGRVFTGDASGDWLFRALHRAGFANQPTSVHRDDGLQLQDCYVAAVVRCAPPDNKPLPAETRQCQPYLDREIALLPCLQVIVTLGKFAFDHCLDLLWPTSQHLSSALDPHPPPASQRPRFGHGQLYRLRTGLRLLVSYHPSQRNTSTKVLTEAMLDSIFGVARQLLQKPATADLRLGS